jgi:hypothetical protein
MRKLCAKAVYKQWAGCGVEHNLCTDAALTRKAACVKTAFFALQSNVLSRRFPHVFLTHSPLLPSLFSPLSTRPITITTIYIN